MKLKIAVLMDPIDKINIKKDSSFAMCLAIQARGWDLFYFEASDLFVQQGRPIAETHSLTVKEDPQSWFTLSKKQSRYLNEFDVILMRKDPPFNMSYIYTTYMLELAEKEGVLIVNKPESLRAANEKFFTTRFPHCCPATLVTQQAPLIKEFIESKGDIILKPLEGMGGKSVFRIQHHDPNANVIIETLTDQGKIPVMAQTYIPEIMTTGDKRILMVDGEPIPYALARIPAKGDGRGNLARGASAKGVPLTERDRWICHEVGPNLKAMGLIFVGLDVIGDYLTEINVTSPTCIRELDHIFQLNIADDLLSAIVRRLASR